MHGGCPLGFRSGFLLGLIQDFETTAIRSGSCGKSQLEKTDVFPAQAYSCHDLEPLSSQNREERQQLVVFFQHPEFSWSN